MGQLGEKVRFSGKETAGLALAQEKTTGYPAQRQ
jgi:hypothetical protein